MTLGLYEERVRKRHRFRWAVIKWLIGLGAIGAAGVFAYESGSTLAQRRLAALEAEITALTETASRFEQEKSDLEAALAKAKGDLREARERYGRDVPTGEIADLLALAREKLEGGVEPDRLAFLIRAAENKRTCDETPVTKRFIVPTPLYSGANDSVGFADGAIVVTAEGASAADESGNPEAWYDPAQPITLRFTHIGGKTTEIIGMLPLHESVVVNDTEHRFNVVAGARGFVQVTGDSCRFP